MRREQVPAASWKHAPGDAAAENVPAATAVEGGDVVVFRAGVAYRGSIAIRASGLVESPIRYLGSGWGEGKATITGYDRYDLPVTSCFESAKCPTGFRTTEFVMVDLPIPINYTSQILMNGRALTLAQSTRLPNGVPDSENIKTFFGITSGDIQKDGDWVRITSRYIHDLLQSGPGYDVTAFIWGAPNLIFYPFASSYDASAESITIRAPHFSTYTNRDMLFAIANHPRLLVREGQYATLNGGKSFLIRGKVERPTAAIEISQREVGINLGGRSNIEIKDFDFEGFVGPPDDLGGVAVINTSAARNIRLTGNDIKNTTSFSRSAALSLSFIDGLVIVGNKISDHRVGRGISLYKSTNVLVEDNSVTNLTFSGILAIGCKNVTIRRNNLTNINGAHGNAVAIYLHNENVLIESNTITDSVRPITFEGANDNLPINLVIARNEIWARGPDVRAAIQSWGGNAVDIAIVSNILIGDHGTGVELRPGDKGIIVANNVMDGISSAGIAPSELSVKGNGFTRHTNGFVGMGGNVSLLYQRDKAVAVFGGDRPSRAICRVLNAYSQKEILGIVVQAVGADAACDP